jgi:superoxide dismutase, Cu-Zn family
MRAFCFTLCVGLLAAPTSSAVLGIGKDKVRATIIGADGVPIGKAVISDSKKNGLHVSIDVKGLPKGEHGVHLHAIGKCEGPQFLTAGAHWNPANKLHGLDSPNGSHAGDLPNLLVSKGGRGKLSFDIADRRFHGPGGLMDDDGATIVVHTMSDDQRTDPSGNSGVRIACGVLIEN